MRLQKVDDLLEARLVRGEKLRFVLRHVPRARRIRGCQAWVPEHRLERAIAGELNLAQMRERRSRSEEHTSELQSQSNLVCRLLLEKKKNTPFESTLLTVH